MDRATRFKYLLVFLVVVSIFIRIHIGLNIIMAVVVTYGLMKYIQDRNKIEGDHHHQQHQEKVDRLKPIPKLITKYVDLVDLFHTIQEYYHDNPQAYEELFDNVNSFLELYEDSDYVEQRCEQRVQVAHTKVRNAANSLHAIIFSLKNPDRIHKLNRAHRKLYHLMMKYLKKMTKRCEDVKLIRGFDTTRHPIHIDDPDPYNFFLNQEGQSFEFY